MTAQAAPAKASPEESDRLKARAEELYRDVALIEREADLALARSEAMLMVLGAAFQLANARKELSSARIQLAEATARFDPVQADLARVQEELAATTITGNLDQRLAARQRRAALLEELGPLEEMAGQLMEPVSSIRNTIVSLERDSVAYFEQELAARKQAVADPPLHDLGKLALVAPDAANTIAMRTGLLTLEPERVRTPHGQQVLVAVMALLRMSGLGTPITAQVEAQLLAELPANLAANVRGALARKRMDDNLPKPPPEYHGITDESIAEQARREGKVIQVDSLGNEPGPSLDRFPTVAATTATGQLPSYDSAEGARLRAADRDSQPRYRGPADWPRLR